MILEGHVGVNTWFFTFSGSKLIKKKGTKDIIQAKWKIILKYYKKGDKQSKCQQSVFSDTGYPVRTQSETLALYNY